MKKLKRIKFTPLITKLNNNKLLLLIIIFYMITSTELSESASKLKLNVSSTPDSSIILDNNLPSAVIVSTQASNHANLITDNETGEGMLLGDACHDTCSPNLQNVVCDEETHTCECHKKYPVRLSPTIGCAKPVRLGEQCFYDRTCSFNELHSTCIQIHHNAICQCKPGYHIVSLHKPRERVFCSEDILIIKTDINTLFGMAAGIAVITGLICFVLKLYSRARYAPPRHYANANLPPPILFASETGIPLAVHRPPSRNSGTRSAPPFSRRPSSSLGLIGPSGGSSSRAGAARAAAILLISCHFDPHNARNIIATTELNEKLRQQHDTTTDDEEIDENNGNNYEMEELFHIDDVTASDDIINIDDDDDDDDGEPQRLQDTSCNKFRGSRRPSTASFHSSSSSIRSYGIRRLEQEQEQRYQRSLMRMQAAQANQSQAGSTGTLQSSSGNLISSSLGSVSFGHSCKTPLSTDDLLPSVCELNEPISQPGSSGSQHKTRTTSLQPIIAPSSSSDSDTSPVDERTRRFLQGQLPSPIP